MLAGNIESVRREQKLAQEAFDEGTSAITEFNVQNNTVQAQLDKAKKSFNELSVELGKDLLPVMRHAITGASALLLVFKEVISVMKENRALIVSVAAGIAGYTVAVKASTVAQNLWNATQKAGNSIAATGRGIVLLLRYAYFRLEGQVRKADVVMKAFNRTTKMSPVGILVGALSAGVAALLSYREKMKSAREAAARPPKPSGNTRKASPMSRKLPPRHRRRNSHVCVHCIGQPSTKPDRRKNESRQPAGCNRSIPIIFPKCRPNKSCWETPKPNTMN